MLSHMENPRLTTANALHGSHWALSQDNSCGFSSFVEGSAKVFPAPSCTSEEYPESKHAPLKQLNTFCDCR